MNQENNLEPLRFETVQMRVADLVAYEKNPRKITAAKKKELIDKLEKFGMIGIPVMDYDGMLVSGKQRCMAKVLVGQGDEITDVRRANRKMTDWEFKEVLLIENTHYGEWDAELLQQEFSEFLDEFDFGIDFAALTRQIEETVGVATTPEMPIVAKYSEKYRAIVIVCPNEIDENHVAEVLRVDTQKSYKSERVGRTSVITAKHFIDAWAAR